MGSVSNVLMIMFSYVIIVGLTFAVINFLSKGLVLKLIRVRLSRGKLTLVEVRDVKDVYYSIGKEDEHSFLFKKRNSTEIRPTSLKQKHFRRFLGCDYLVYDIPSDKVITLEGEREEVTNRNDNDSMLKRCLMVAGLKENKEKVIIVAAIILVVVVAVALYYMFGEIQQIKQLIAAMKEAKVGTI